MINKDPYIDVQKGHYNVKTRDNGLWVSFTYNKFGTCRFMGWM